MNYSQVGIANMALQRIGARGQITSIYENSPNAIKVLAVWDMILQETLAERDWKFAKTRTELQLSTQTPLYGWAYAWAMPSDFLRFVRPQKRAPDPWYWAWIWGPEGWGWYCRNDPPFWPDWPYKVEAIAPPVTTPPSPPQSSPKFVLTNYGGTYGNAKITYIQLISDYTQLMPGFVNALAYRLAQELAIGITEDKSKAQMMESAYREALNSAEAQNETMDSSKDESGSDRWLNAGRFTRWY